MTGHALIVEPYLSGGLLPGALRRCGVTPIGLHLRPMTHRIAATFRAHEYPEHFVYPGDVATLRQRLAGVDIVAVFAGQEAGVELADQLCAAFGVVANDPVLSAARRDKYVMHRRLAAAGLRAIRQTRSADPAALIEWIEAEACWPAVVKPVNSGGTDGVCFCRTPGDVIAAHAASIGRTNLLGFPNVDLLAQELIEGTEYIVDAVSCAGRHEIVNVARYAKEVTDAGAPIYRTIDFIDPSEWPRHAAMLDYVRSALDALGISVGPSHSEVFVDANGPVLVETGARLCGAMVPHYLDEISTGSILDLAVAAAIAPARFEMLAAQPRAYAARLRAFVLRTRQSGLLRDRPGEALVRGLRTFRDVSWFGEPGDPVQPTRDLMSALGMVFMRAGDDAALDADVRELRRLEDAELLVSVAAP